MAEFKIEKEYALKIIKAMRTNWDEDSKTLNAHALDMAIAALEKQIPKKWQYEMVNDDDTYVCPCCKEYWYMEYGNPTTNEYNYCPMCGQALKWE